MEVLKKGYHSIIMVACTSEILLDNQTIGLLEK
jgi:hypothetical protein